MVFFNFFLFLSLLSNIVVSTPIDLNQLNIGVWLSGAAYCGKDKYKSMSLSLFIERLYMMSKQTYKVILELYTLKNQFMSF